MVGVMGLSHKWRVVLTRLAEYPDGIRRDDFTNLMGGGRFARGNIADTALEQMHALDHMYWERDPADRERIRITAAGREALGDD